MTLILELMGGVATAVASAVAKRARLMSVGILWFLVACGTPDSEESIAAPSLTEQTPTTAVAASPGPASTTDLAPTTTERPTPPGLALSTVLNGLPDRAGNWALAAGRWTSGAFERPVTFTTVAELLLIADGLGVVYLQDPTIDERHLIAIFEPAVSFGADGREEPVARTFDEVDESLRANDVMRVLDNGSAESFAWWDVALGADHPELGWPCHYAQRCVPAFRTVGAELLMLPAELSVRLYMVMLETGPLFVVAGGAGDSDGLNDIGENLSTSLLVTAEPESSGRRFLRSVGAQGGELPAGTFVETLGAGAVEIDVPAGSGVRAPFVERDTVFLLSDLAVVGLQSARGLVPPEFDQSSDLSGLAPDDFLDANGWGADDFDRWLGSLVVIEGRGETGFGNVQMSWWDVTVNGTVVSSPCGTQRTPQGAGDCVDLFALDLAWFVSSEQPTRIYYSPEAQLMMTIKTEVPGSLLADALAEVTPLLDGMTFRPAE